MNILVMNAGSSSQKSYLYGIEAEDTLPETPPVPLWEGRIEWSAPGGATLTVKRPSGQAQQEILPNGTARKEGLARLLATLWSGDTAPLEAPGEIDVVGHRVVHGGQQFQQPTRLTPELKAAIDAMTVLAPEHNPAAREGMDAVEQALGSAVPQVAVFDTAFHSSLSDAAAFYPGPYDWVAQGIRRYGFHGINHAWCAERAAQLLPDHDPGALRLITCHLGNGCSLAAVRGGRSVDTTMGFTPMEGLMMGSRSGSIDPGILLYLLRQPDVSVSDLDRLLNKDSGLEGISGISEDMRAVLAAIGRGEERPRLAFDMYIHRLRWHIGAMLASLGGLDALVFTAGVGENSSAVRAAACADFGFLGLVLDEAKNETVLSPPIERDIAHADSKVRVLIIPAQEDWTIARECVRLARAPSDRATGPPRRL